jgi:hypothetical protein
MSCPYSQSNASLSIAEIPRLCEDSNSGKAKINTPRMRTADPIPARQVISKQRVTDHGEVYTAPKEVQAMLDMVKQETERIDSRFLEPACGNGNFLAEILARKLRVVERRYRKSQLEYERNAVMAVASLYGIDKLADNVAACRNRLFDIFDKSYTGRFKGAVKADCRTTVALILSRNIIHGNALTLLTESDPPEPIIFSEWSFPFNNSLIKRCDYTFADLLGSTNASQTSLSFEEEYSDLGVPAFIPKMKQNFRPIPFLKLAEEHG